MMMVGTHIECCVSNGAQVTIIAGVYKLTDAQHGYRVMNHVTKTSVDQIMMAATSDKKYVSLALAALAFCPRKLYANLGGNGLIDGNFLALIWTPTD